MPRVVALVALVVVGSAARAHACDVAGPSTPGVAATVVIPAGFVGFRFGPTFGLLVGAELTGARVGPRASYGGYGRIFAIDSPRGSTWDVEAGFAAGPSFESEGCSAGRRVAFARVGVGLRGPLDAPDRTFAARVSTMGAAFFAGFLGLSIPLGRSFSPELSVGVGLGVPIEVH